MNISVIRYRTLRMDNITAQLSEINLISIFNLTKTAASVHIGEQATVYLVNDAMLNIWSKDRTVVGKALTDALPILGAMPLPAKFARVWRSGSTLSELEIPVKLQVEGKPKIFYFNFEYRAVRNEKEETACILFTAVDVTERVLNREKLQKADLAEKLFIKNKAFHDELAGAYAQLSMVNEELLQSQQALNSTEEALEERVESRVTQLYQSEAKFRSLSDELAAINEEMSVANEELMASNEEIIQAQHALQDTFDQLEDREIALRLAVEAANFGTWHVHSVTRKFITSDRLRELFGFHKEKEITIEDAVNQIADEYRSYVSEKLENAIQGNGNYDVSYPVVGFHDQRIRWLRAIGNLKADKSGQFSSFTGVVMDISELKKDDERKNDFIGMVSHELKTPLTSLKGYIQILQLNARKSTTPFVTEALEKANRQVKKMTSMINGFLNISRLEAGKIVLNKAAFRLDQLIITLVEEANFLNTHHHIIYEEPVEINIIADEDKIGNVISNLLNNAVKYSQDNTPVTVTCKMADHIVQVDIRDEGMGIEAVDIDKLFERYYRAQNNNTIAGFGIGLYVCAEIVGRHNGKIWADSEPGHGATFSFTLPLND